MNHQSYPKFKIQYFLINNGYEADMGILVKNPLNFVYSNLKFVHILANKARGTFLSCNTYYSILFLRHISFKTYYF